jgi:hypothetical protein
MARPISSSLIFSGALLLALMFRLRTTREAAATSAVSPVLDQREELALAA